MTKSVIFFDGYLTRRRWNDVRNGYFYWIFVSNRVKKWPISTIPNCSLRHIWGWSMTAAVRCGIVAGICCTVMYQPRVVYQRQRRPHRPCGRHDPCTPSYWAKQWFQPRRRVVFSWKGGFSQKLGDFSKVVFQPKGWFYWVYQMRLTSGCPKIDFTSQVAKWGNLPPMVPKCGI